MADEEEEEEEEAATGEEFREAWSDDIGFIESPAMDDSPTSRRRGKTPELPAPFPPPPPPPPPPPRQPSTRQPPPTPLPAGP